MGVHPPQNGGIGYDPWPNGIILSFSGGFDPTVWTLRLDLLGFVA